MSGPHPVSFETLVALWAGELPEDEASAVEEHLFACDACAAAQDRFAPLASALREFIPPVISAAHRDRLAASGVRIRFTPCAADAEATAAFAPDVDLLVHGLRGDLSRAERVDVEMIAPDGTVARGFDAVPFDRAAGEVLVACQRHYEALFAPGEQPFFRVYAHEAGERRQVGEYLVVHIWR